MQMDTRCRLKEIKDRKKEGSKGAAQFEKEGYRYFGSEANSDAQRQRALCLKLRHASRHSV